MTRKLRCIALWGAACLTVVACRSSAKDSGAISRERPSPPSAPSSAALAPPRFLATIARPLTIELYAVRGLAKSDAFVGKLREVFAAWEKASPKVKTSVVLDDDVEFWPTTKKRLAIATPSDPAGDTERDVLGLVIGYGGERAVVDRLSLDDLPTASHRLAIAARNARDLEDKISRGIGVLVDGRPGAYSRLEPTFSRYFPMFKLALVDTKHGTVPIDPALAGLLVTQPTEPIDDGVARRVDEFLIGGKPVAVFADPARIKSGDPAMMVTFDGLGVDTLLARYGVTYAPGLLADTNDAWRPTMSRAGGTPIVLPAYSGVFLADQPPLPFDRNFAPFLGLSAMSLPLPMELRTAPTPKGVELATVLHSSSSIRRLTGTTFSMHPDKDGMGAVTTIETFAQGKEARLGVVLKGAIPSAFSPGALAKPGARLLVVASYAFFENFFAEAGKSPFEGMEGIPAGLGQDETLMQWAQTLNQAHTVRSTLVAKQTCDWFIDDESM